MNFRPPLKVLGLHREFLRAGSDVMQAFTFYASDDKLINRGNKAGKNFTGADINRRASELAKQVAAENGALTLGGICQCPTYLSGVGKQQVQEEFRKQIQVFVDTDLDFLLCEVKRSLTSSLLFVVPQAISSQSHFLITKYISIL